MSRKILAGACLSHIGLLGSAGFGAGQKGTGIAAGDSSGMYPLKDLRQVAITTDEGQSTPIERLNKVVGNWLWGALNITKVEIELAAKDSTLMGYVGGTTETTTTPSSYYKFHTPEQQSAARPLVYLLLSELTQDADGIDGVTGYNNILISRATAYIRRGGLNFQDKNNQTLVISPLVSLYTPLGYPVNSFGLGVRDNELTALEFFSTKQVHIHTFQKNGSTATFTTYYKPANSSAVAATGSNLIFDDGAVTNPTSVATTTGLVTLTAVGTSGKNVEMLYEHDGVTS